MGAGAGAPAAVAAGFDDAAAVLAKLAQLQQVRELAASVLRQHVDAACTPAVDELAAKLNDAPAGLPLDDTWPDELQRQELSGEDSQVAPEETEPEVNAEARSRRGATKKKPR